MGWPSVYSKWGVSAKKLVASGAATTGFEQEISAKKK
jgi:hypothetical protein